MKPNNYKREFLSLLNKYKAHVLVLIATLGIGLLGCENKAVAKASGAEEQQEQQEYYRFTSIAAGFYHTVGIAKDGTLWSWGENGKGQLGDGTTANKSIPVRLQQKTEAEPFVDNTTKWKAVSAGGEHTVAIDIDGYLWSWGRNDEGQLGDGTNGETTNKSIPVRVQQKTEEETFVENITKWKAVAAGEYHTVGIDIDGNLWSWGWNNVGQLGDGTAGDGIYKSIPVRVKQTTEAGPLEDNTTKWKAVAAGRVHTVGIDSDGTLWSWGKNESGQLGDGTTINKSTPVRVKQTTEAGPLADNTTEWKAVSAGYNHTAGIDIDGSFWSWGVGGAGSKSIPVRVKQTTEAGPLEDNTTKWKALSAGKYRTEVIDSNGFLWEGAPGQVWEAIAAGYNHIVGIDSDGNLWSWGSNDRGQLGDGTTISYRDNPVKLQKIPK